MNLDTRNRFILIDCPDTGSQLFRLRLKLQSTPATAKIRWRVVLQVNVEMFDFFFLLSSIVAFLYQERGFMYVNILICLSGLPARNFFCIP